MTKFERPEAWSALEREDAAFWAGREPEERAVAVLGMVRELLEIARQQDPGRAAASDAVRRAEKLSQWMALKEHLKCRSATRPSSKSSSGAR